MKTTTISFFDFHFYDVYYLFIILMMLMISFGKCNDSSQKATQTHDKNQMIFAGQYDLIPPVPQQFPCTYQSDISNIGSKNTDDFMAAVGIIGHNKKDSPGQLKLFVKVKTTSSKKLQVEVQYSSTLLQLIFLRISYILIDKSLNGVFAIQQGIIETGFMLNQYKNQYLETLPVPPLDNRASPITASDIEVNPILTGYSFQKNLQSNYNFYLIHVDGYMHNQTHYKNRVVSDQQNFELTKASASITTIFFSIKAAQDSFIRILVQKTNIPTLEFYDNQKNKQNFEEFFQNQTQFYGIIDIEAYNFNQITDPFAQTRYINSWGLQYIRQIKFTFNTYKCPNPQFPNINTEINGYVFCHRNCSKGQYMNLTTAGCQACRYDCQQCENSISCTKCSQSHNRQEVKMGGTIIQCRPMKGYFDNGTQTEAVLCTSGSTCGDGIFITQGYCPEECDDGNTVDKDGCSSTCRLQPGYECNQMNWQDPVCYYTHPFEAVFTNLTKLDQQNTLTFNLTVSTLNHVVLQEMNQTWSEILYTNIPSSVQSKFQVLASSTFITFKEADKSIQSNIMIQVKIQYSEHISDISELQLNFTPSASSNKKYQNALDLVFTADIFDQNNMRIQFFSNESYSISLATEYLLICMSILVLLIGLLSVIGVKMIVVQILLVFQCTYFSLIGFVNYGGIPSVKALSALRISALLIPFNLDLLDEFSWIGLQKSFIQNGILSLLVFTLPFLFLIIFVVLSMTCLKGREKAQEVLNILKYTCIYEIPLFLYLCFGLNLTVSFGLSIEQIQEPESSSFISNPIIDFVFGTVFLLIGILMFFLYWFKKQQYSDLWSAFFRYEISERWVNLLIGYIWLNSIVLVALRQYWFSNLITVFLNCLLIAFLKNVQPFKMNEENSRSMHLMILNIIIQLMIMIEKLLIQFASYKNSTNSTVLYLPFVIAVALLVGLIYCLVLFVGQMKQRILALLVFLNEPSKIFRKNNTVYDLDIPQDQMKFLKNINKQKNVKRNIQNKSTDKDTENEKTKKQKIQFTDDPNRLSLSKNSIQKEFAKIGSINSKRYKQVKQGLKRQLLCNLAKLNPSQNQQMQWNINTVQLLLENQSPSSLAQKLVQNTKQGSQMPKKKPCEEDDFWENFFDEEKSKKPPRFYYDPFHQI